MATTTEKPTAAQLREQKEEREAAEQAAAERVAADQAAMEAAREAAAAEAPAYGEEDDGQLFVLEDGRKVTLGTLITRGTSVEYEIKLGGKAIKGKGEMGLIAFENPDIMLIVPGRAGKVEIDPTYDGDGTVQKVKVRAHIKPTMVYDAASADGRAALNGE